MFRKILQFSTVLLLLLSYGWSPMDTDAQSDQKNIYLPMVSTGPSFVYLPLVMKPWLNSTFGVEVQSLNETTAMRAQEAKSAWVRINALYWSGYQPNNSSEFRTNPELEQELIKADQSGMEVILIIHRTPLWAREYPDSVCGPIRSDMLDEFANFMTMVVQKYSQPPFNVLYYELWNEPDLPVIKNKSAFNVLYYELWNEPEHPVIKNEPETPQDESNIPYGCWGSPEADFYGGGNYADMLKVVTPAMKSVNPNVKIVVGGLLLDCDPALPDEQCIPWKKKMAGYFEGILQAGGGNYFDVVSYHAYNYYDAETSPIQMEYEIPNWKNSGGQVEGRLAFLRQVMTDYGIDKPVIHSEAGLICYSCFTFPPDYEQDKAEYVVWLYTRNWSKGILATTWYTLDKGGWRGTGLLDAQNNPTPAFYAYKTMTNTLYGASFTREVNLWEGVTIFEFQKGLNVWVLFSMDGNPKSINLSTYATMLDIEAFDLFGNLCGTVGTDCFLQGSQLTFDLPVFLRFHK